MVVDPAVQGRNRHGDNCPCRSVKAQVAKAFQHICLLLRTGLHASRAGGFAGSTNWTLSPKDKTKSVDLPLFVSEGCNSNVQGSGWTAIGSLILSRLAR